MIALLIAVPVMAVAIVAGLALFAAWTAFQIGKALPHKGGDVRRRCERGICRNKVAYLTAVRTPYRAVRPWSRPSPPRPV
jgi:hypothetical protein